jgi:hypothetical protein
VNLSTFQSLQLFPARQYVDFSFFNVTRHIAGGTQRRIWQGTTGDYLYGYHGGYKVRYYGEQWQLQGSDTTANNNWDINCYIRGVNGAISTITFNGQYYFASTSTSFLGLEKYGHQFQYGRNIRLSVW